MNKLIRFVALPTLCLLMGCAKPQEVTSYSVVPMPREVKLTEENPFCLNENTVVAYPAGNTLLKRNAEFLSEYISQSLAFTLPVQELEEGHTAKHAIVLTLNSTISNKEGYRLSVTEKGVVIEGQTEQGVFYGIQTLRKSLPALAESKSILLPSAVVDDEPRFTYRGMHLDVCRHFFSVEFVKEYIDLLALHNMNTFHWHLTDDQGWRIESKKYPKLTEVGSVRHRTVVGYLGSGIYDPTEYGGYYTQEQMKEVVAYAAERYINVVPEIDLPGHTLAVLASYPEFGCTGGPYEVCPDWGVFPDVLCIGNEQTMEFVEDILGELIEIFPSKYIHIGGDEAPRTRWKKCPKCQKRIADEGLKASGGYTAEDRLQSYCMQRAERFLNSHGRSVIGWDEILNGDIAPNATVMSWQGTVGGIKAAQMGHDVIMTPNTHCYFDFYQTDDTRNEPLAIGGCLPVSKVYELDPTVGLTDKQAKHILGVQANLWTEYITTTEHVEYMVLPRMAALAEVQWTAAKQKDYRNFQKRVVHLMKLYHKNRWNYAKHLYDLHANFQPDMEKRQINVTLDVIDDASIYYTLDGSEPTSFSTCYTDTFHIDKSVQLRAKAIRPDGKNSGLEESVSFNKATLCPIRFLSAEPYPNYTFGGAVTLVDGRVGNENFATGAWLGFVGEEVSLLIDLQQPTEISRLSLNAMTYMDAWIMAPTTVTVSVSDDNKKFIPIANKQYPVDTDIHKRCISTYDFNFNAVTTRYVKLSVQPSPTLPVGHSAEGKAPFLFVDEIAIF